MIPTSFIFAAIDPKDAKQTIMFEWGGGINNWSSAHKIAQEESPNMLNMFNDEKEGSLTKRTGYLFSGSTSSLNGIKSFFEFAKESGGREYLVTDSSSLYTTTDFKTYTFLIGGLNTNSILHMAQIRNKVWCTNGVDSVFNYDGSTVVVLNGSTYGTTKTPNVPRFKYIAGFQERVFGLNTSADGSSLDFSALSSTDGFAISPDDSRAWPSTNRLEIGQGDGTVGTALWNYRAQLQIGKESSIYSLFGTDETSYFARKTDAQVGVASQDTVVVLDNLTYFLSKDGGYAFDGGQTLRLTDKIKETIKNIRIDVSNVLSNTWETQTDFSRGDQIGTTITPSGFVTIYSTNETRNINTLTSTVPVENELRLTITTSTGWGTLISTSLPEPSFYGYVSQIRLWQRGNCSVSNKILLYNTASSETYKLTASLVTTSDFNIRNAVYDGTGAGIVYFSGKDIINKKLKINIEFTGSDVAVNRCEVYVATTAGNAEITLTPATTGQFISDVSTITVNTNTAWGKFDSIFSPNSGSVNHFYRTSTSTVNITTYPWKSVTAGSNINAPLAEKFIQWASTVNGVDPINFPNIDRVTIDHVEGDAGNTKSFAMAWKNRYWLNVSTESTGNFPLIIVKNRVTGKFPNGFTFHTTANPFKAFATFNNLFYAGSSTSSSIYRMDIGYNDDGNAIDAFYETPDMVLGDLFNEKSIIQYMLDADRYPNSTLQLKTSINGGTYKTLLISLNGTKRLLKPIRNLNYSGKYFRIRFENNDNNVPLTINSFGLKFQPDTIDDVRADE